FNIFRLVNPVTIIPGTITKVVSGFERIRPGFGIMFGG
ncbi:unnamed protein product, partial [marine sediment metagenome]